MAIWNAPEIEAGLHGLASEVSIRFPEGSDLAEWADFISANTHLQPIDFAVVSFTTCVGVKRSGAVFWFPREYLAYLGECWVNTSSIEDAIVAHIKRHAESDAATRGGEHHGN